MPESRAGSTWVKLGDVVENINEYYDRTSSDPERYVAGEHIDEGSLTIRRWGKTSDDLFPPTFNRRFRAGDVLFHSRNLKKLVRADFDGITGEKLFVLRVSQPDRLRPDLLPFLLQTEHFAAYVNRMWAGSTNKFLNKTPLMKYEFPLPVPDEQVRLARLFSALSAVMEAAIVTAKSAERLLSSLLMHSYPKRPEVHRPLAQWCKHPITYGIVQAGPDTSGGVPYIRVSDISDGTVGPNKLLRTTPEIAAKYKRSEVQGGDLVVALRGPIGLAVPVPPELSGANLTQGTARVSVRRDLCRDYVRWALASPAIQRQISQLAKGSTFKEISLAGLRELNLPWISPEDQEQIAQQLNQLSDAVERALQYVTQARALFSRCLAHTLRAELA